MKLQPTGISVAILTMLFPAIPLATAATAYPSIDLSPPDGENRVLFPGDTVTRADAGAAVNIRGTNNSLSGNSVSIRAGIAGTSVGAQGVTVSAGGTLGLSDSNLTALGEFNADALVVRDAGSLATLNGTRTTTEGRYSYGVHAIDGGRAEVTGGSVSTQGDEAHGLHAAGTDAVITARETQITVLGDGASAVHAADGASVVLDQARLHATAATNWGGKGISVERGAVTATNAEIVSVRGTGIHAAGGSISYFNGTIDAYRDGVYLTRAGGAVFTPSKAELRDVVVHAETGSGIDANADGVHARLERVQISSNGSFVAGIRVPSESVVLAKDVSIRMTGENALGVDNRAGAVTMDGGSITTLGASGHGIYVSELYGGSGTSATTTAHGVAVETFGNAAIGVVSRLSGSRVVLEGGSVTTHGDTAYGLLANGARLEATGTIVRTAGDNAHGLMMGNQGAQASLDGVDIRTGGTGANGMQAYSNTPGVDNAIGIRNSHIEAARGNGISVEGGGLIANLVDTTIIGGSRSGEGTLLYVDERRLSTPSGSTTIAARNVQLNAQRSHLVGDVLLDSGSASVTLRDHSVLTGTLRNNAGRTLDTLSIDGSSTWRVRGNSAVARLDNAGTVSFATPGSGFKVLDVTGNLGGGGLFEMRTDLGAGQGDLLRVAGTVTGNHRVLVANSGAEPLAGHGSLRIIQSEGGPGSFALANRDQLVDAGTYRYALKSSDTVNGRATDWSLVNAIELSPEAVPAPDQSRIGPPDNLSTAANAAVNTSSAGTAHAIWHAETGTLAKRMGELRQGKNEGGVWVRGFGERQKLDNRGARSFEQTVGGLAVGVDKSLPVEGGRWYVGAMTGYSSTDRRFRDEGTGGADSYHFGGYATWLADAGWYVDGMFKANKIQQNFAVVATDGQSVKAASHQNAIGVSVEAGRQMPFGFGWFVEPQVALSMLRASGASYRASNGLQVDAGSGNSMRLRVGSLLGRHIAFANGNAVQPYLKLSLSQELDGRSTVRTNGVATRTDLSGGLAELGVGVAASLGTNHRLYADYGYASGARLDKPWTLSMGYRYSW
ncbi:autotransporter outer membrane beta-barrel domain-containing protein [Cupriavidus basilensis]|uniref:Pertactin n=1 Tax=Cupriavidus basilensis TaxID=68895 RepID=A0A0C4Y8N1_9BURK|nr:autotransporter outer membrane beta-barrel domain-containing protein [Cupriavidus basilensis]AJG19340.1 Pertactin precursor [Cupriavidus basilensis]